MKTIFGYLLYTLAFVSALFSVTWNAFADESDYSYLIFSASVVNREMQPHWICLEKAQRCIHVPASKGLIKVRAGKYDVHHIDFSKSMGAGDTDILPVTNKKARSGGGSQFMVVDLNLEVKPGLIYFVGELELTQRKSRKYKVKLNQDTKMIESVCRKFPEVFRKLPVSSIDNRKKLKVTCG